MGGFRCGPLTSPNVQVVNYISTHVRALKIYPELPEMSIRQHKGVGLYLDTNPKVAYPKVRAP